MEEFCGSRSAWRRSETTESTEELRWPKRRSDGVLVPASPVLDEVVVEDDELEVVTAAGSAEEEKRHGDAASTASSSEATSPNAVQREKEGERKKRMAAEVNSNREGG